MVSPPIVIENQRHVRRSRVSQGLPRICATCRRELARGEVGFLLASGTKSGDAKVEAWLCAGCGAQVCGVLLGMPA